VLGVGGGFRLLCSLGLLPGQVTLRAAGGAPVRAPPSHLRVEGRPTPFTSAIPAGRIMRVAPSTSTASNGSDACYQSDALERLAARGQIVLRFCDAAGGAVTVSGDARPPSSAHSIAGICNGDGNVVGMLCDLAAVTAGCDSQQLLRSLDLHLGAARAHAR
jgi:phosphoribosylformylglycinamidine (FGAM) synthase-like amidotransferase family enzyme